MKKSGREGVREDGGAGGRIDAVGKSVKRKLGKVDRG